MTKYITSVTTPFELLNIAGGGVWVGREYWF